MRCEGKIGCVPEAWALAAWHDKLAANWTHFVTELRRTLPDGVELQYFKTYEEQARGALHVHVMMRLIGVVTWQEFVSAVGKAKHYNGFGKQMRCEQIDLADPSNAARKAGYCAKYTSKNADALPAVVRLDPVTGETRRGGFRSWSASWSWGDRMWQVQERRRKWAVQSSIAKLDDGTPAPEAPLTCNEKSTQEDDPGSRGSDENGGAEPCGV